MYYDISKNNFRTLKILVDEGVTSFWTALTISQLLSETNLGKRFDYQSLYRSLNDLLDTDYVACGAKDGKAYTYFASEKGTECVNDFYISVENLVSE